MNKLGMQDSGWERRRILIGRLGLPVSALVAGCAGPGVLPPTYATGEAAQREAALPPSAATLFYVTASDCPFCREWETKDSPAFEQSLARQKLRYVKLYAELIKSGLFQDYTWPTDVRWVRDEIRNRGKEVRRAFPFFVLVQDQRVIAAGGGTRYWRETMVPAMNKATETA